MKAVGTEHLPLFGQPSATGVGLAARDRTASRHAAEIEALIPLAQELARRAYPNSITVADIRVVAVQRGLLTGTEPGRQLSWLGAVPDAAGLERTGEYRRSFLAKSNGNLQACWRLAA